MKSEKHLSMCARIRERGRLRARRFGFRASSSPPKLAIGLILLVLFLSFVPMAKAEPPIAETVTWGTWTGDMPTNITMSDDAYRSCTSELSALIYYCLATYEFLKPAVDPVIATLTLEGKASLPVKVQVWNGTNWNTRFGLYGSGSDEWHNYTFESSELQGNPEVRFTQTSLAPFTIDIDLLTFRSWTDLSEMQKEIEELRKKLDEVHTGEIIDPTEKLLPYPPGTREGLDVDYIVVDPYRELFYNHYSDPDAAATVTLPIAYDTSWSDVDMLTDQVYIGDFTGTLYLNDTTDSTKILQTTQSYSHFLVNATSEGHALTAEVTSGSVKVSRMARVHATFTFDWYVDPHTYEHRTVFSIDNDLTENWREVVIVVAGNPDYTIQSESVEVWDLDNNVELTTANYECTATSFRMGLTWLNASTSRSFKIIYAPYQEGSDYQEPVGIYRWDEASSATLNNRVWMVDQVAINNPNSIDCSVGTRISIDMTSIPGDVAMIHVITADGSYLTQGPPLGNQWFTFTGLEIPARSTVTVSVYVKVQGAALEAEDLRPLGLAIFTTFFILMFAAMIGWIATKSDKKLYKWTDPARGITFIFALLTAAGFIMAFWPSA